MKNFNFFSSRASVLLFILSIGFVFLAAAVDYYNFPYTDGAEHGAAVRALARDYKNPGDPMLAGCKAASSRFVPSILAMALFMRASDIGVLKTIDVFLIVFFLFFVMSASLFVREYFNDTGIIPWALLSVLCLWGTGWTGANAYKFSALLYTAYFPSVVSFSCALLALSLQLHHIRTGGCLSLAGMCAFGSLSFVNHPLTGTFFFISSALLYIERSRTLKKGAAEYAGIVLCSIVFVHIWPYYDFFADLGQIAAGGMGATWDYRLTRSYLYSDIAVRILPAIAGMPVLAWCAIKKKFFYLTAGFVIFCTIYSAGCVFDISLSERFVFFWVFCLQLSFAFLCRRIELIPFNSKIIKLIVSASLAGLLGVGVMCQLVQTGREYIIPNFSLQETFPYVYKTSPNSMQHQWKNYIYENDVVLSDVPTSWSVPVYTGAKIVSLFHTPPHVRDNEERKKDVNRFFSATTSNAVRKQILKKFSVTKVLVHYQVVPRKFVNILSTMGLDIIVETDRYAVLTVPRDFE